MKNIINFAYKYMSYLKRGMNFFSKHIKNNKAYLFTYAVNFFNPIYVPKIAYYELNEVVNLLKSGKSLIRYGDGEFYIMNFGSIHYQDFDPNLRNFFFKIAKDYQKDSPYVLCMNKIPFEKTNRQLKKDGLFHCWLPGKVMYNLFFNKNIKYVDQVLFYYNETIPTYLESYLLTKHLILVSNEKNISKFKENKSIPFKNVSFILTPATNAFTTYESIKSSVREEVIKYGRENTIVLAACGPASKPLAYELSYEGIVTIDVGRGIEVAYTDERIDYIIYPAGLNKK